MSEPRFTHDCKNCTFLGGFEHDGDYYDLYHCMQGGNCPTVIARFSDDGPDYQSGMPFADKGLIATLVEAKRRAVERGLSTTVEGR